MKDWLREQGDSDREIGIYAGDRQVKIDLWKALLAATPKGFSVQATFTRKEDGRTYIIGVTEGRG